VRIVDLRSDTATKPTPEMREAMKNAEVGDDVLAEDPTINELQELGASMVGKEAALFVTSGIQGNLIAILTHTRPGDDVICDAQSHVCVNMTGGVAALGGVTTNAVAAEPGGWMSPEAVEAAIQPPNCHLTHTSLVSVENTNNAAGGTVWTPQQVQDIADVCRRRGLKLHGDGARLFNSAVAQGVDVTELADPCDTVMFCLSKGLGAPVGSLLAGPADFIAEARRKRKMLGGGMRQAGVLAACGIISLTKMVGRLAEDHANAHKLAEAMADMPGISINLDSVQTNIIRFEFHSDRSDCAAFVDALAERGVLCLASYGSPKARMVTHNDVSADDIDHAIPIIREAAESLA